MKRLSQILPDNVGGGITLLDVGASGQVSDYWKQLSRITHLIGFEPNTEECERLNAQKTAFLSNAFFPMQSPAERGNIHFIRPKASIAGHY